METLPVTHAEPALQLVPGSAQGRVLACSDGISFWGGVDPESGRIIDVHHPNHGATVTGRVLAMPTSRGSCSGSGVLLELALTGRAPAALVFCEGEETLTLGALVAQLVFGKTVPVLRLPASLYAALTEAETAQIDDGRSLRFDGTHHPVTPLQADALSLSPADRHRLDGGEGPVVQRAMQVLCQMAAAQGAVQLMDVTRGHIDGCILAHDANLIFAEKMAELGAQVAIPTTINAISVDRENWQTQGLPADFGARASRLADAYVRMGAQPTFTCAPYLLDDRPAQGEAIGWSESNAVIYANTVLGARTVKHPDYLDLFIAMTGRAPLAGVYTDQGRRPRRRLRMSLPPARQRDESVWALVGWLAGRASPDRVPLILGLENERLSADDLKSICAAFGTTSGAPLLHVAGHTPEADLAPVPEADKIALDTQAFAEGWVALNQATEPVDLVAIGSPHASLSECQRLAELLAGRSCEAAPMIVTVGRHVLAQASADGTLATLQAAGAQVIPDLCWCSITEPIFPTAARSILTNSGKYAHYADGLSGRPVRLAGLAACVEASVTGRAPERPDWARVMLAQP